MDIRGGRSSGEVKEGTEATMVRGCKGLCGTISREDPRVYPSILVYEIEGSTLKGPSKAKVYTLSKTEESQ